MDPIPKSSDRFWQIGKRTNWLRGAEQEIYPDVEPEYIVAANAAFASLADQKERLEKVDNLREADRHYDIETLVNDMYPEISEITQLYSNLLETLFEESQSDEERLELTSGVLASIDNSHWDILTKLLGQAPTAFWVEATMKAELKEAYESMTYRQFCEHVRLYISEKMTDMIDKVGDAVCEDEDDD